MRSLAILGSTGSIGVSTLDVVRLHPDRFSVFSLTANRNVEAIFSQCLEFQPQLVAMADEAAAQQLEQRLRQEGLNIDVVAGESGLREAATNSSVDILMAAIVGAAGLLPTLAAVHLGKRVLLANKEALVLAGDIFMGEASHSGSVILPIDSEHNAIFQCLPDHFETGPDGLGRIGVERILLTASGGPFRDLDRAHLNSVTPAQACAHPNWDMGKKISVDSATMMNKGLEVIEAKWLFSAEPDQIQVVVHPESVIHSMVQYVDGSTLAQLGNPDMRTPIAQALAWPDRMASGVQSLSLFDIAQLNFESPDLDRFPCLGLAFDAVREGGTLPAVLNAANEVAVEAFLQGQLGFMAIPGLISEVMSGLPAVAIEGLDHLLEVDRNARVIAEQKMRSAVA